MLSMHSVHSTCSTLSEKKSSIISSQHHISNGIKEIVSIKYHKPLRTKKNHTESLKWLRKKNADRIERGEKEQQSRGGDCQTETKDTLN